ncbi:MULTISPECIES: DUF523 domain-containing protein [Arcobacter]|jgi:uncharacterized protein YbbK (DUF523 family)|uniref:DUF523 domain-containing protein n=1 Tax=Arcobacter ellisii TaxID=913109 RepID=A0A347U884_9BACT|nr:MULTISPECIES: DUF523 domain-containing protein [Arcobacter]AXX95062.1 DUF523 domain-containing protein [Arcobacter ellisii]MDD3008473.1 DUF523 domain-containing protein [Arcobacter sp.]MDY3204442.1 DUF523 domain-containing protein [Arcobacter sp.]RXI30383.1 hypothetical protein CP962_08530 [Arcobacter ellisii]
MKILVSSCLLGEDVRYDGNNSSIAFDPKFPFSLKELFMDILCENEIYSFCPEVAGGLPIPRISAEIVKNDKPFIVKNQEGLDVTINFLLGAKKALDICKEENIKVALLKSKSPSCGNKEIYDGTFSSNLINGQGLTAKLLEENGIKVFNENELKELNKFIKTNK